MKVTPTPPSPVEGEEAYTLTLPRRGGGIQRGGQFRIRVVSKCLNMLIAKGV